MMFSAPDSSVCASRSGPPVFALRLEGFDYVTKSAVRRTFDVFGGYESASNLTFSFQSLLQTKVYKITRRHYFHQVHDACMFFRRACCSNISVGFLPMGSNTLHASAAFRTSTSPHRSLPLAHQLYALRFGHETAVHSHRPSSFSDVNQN
jgi:hypothetical protein